MSGEEHIEKKLEELARAIGDDEGLVENVMSRVDEVTATSNDKSESSVLSLARRLNMKGYRKLAAAALIIIAAALMMTVFDKSPAYALDQTVEALRNARFMHFVRHDGDGSVKDERWIEIGMDGLQVRYRQQSPEGVFAIEDGNSTGVYHHDKQTVVIYDREDKQYQWISELGVFLENLRQEGEIIKENDEYMGRAAHKVLWPMMGGECYVDPRTKLPIAIGDAEFSYEQPAVGTFEIVIPDGYAVIDLREGAETVAIPQWLRDLETAGDSFGQATYALAGGEFAEAARLFEFVTSQEPGRNWAWYWLGSAYYGLGQYEAAIEQYNKVLEMFEGQTCHYCYYARSLAYKRFGMDEAAAADMEVCLGVMVKALRIPTAAAMFEYAGNPLARYGNYKPSEAELVANMIDRLRIGTGLDFGFDPNGTEEEKEAAIAAWEQWYQESAGSQ